MSNISNIFSRIANLQTISSFKVPAYRWYFLGLVGMWISFAMNQVAQTYLVYEITDSKAMLGIITLAGTAPILILSLFGGAIADRLPKKLLMQLSHGGFAVIFTGYLIADLLGYLTPEHPESWWVILVGGLVMGIFIALSMPARGALIPELVERDKLMNAVSLNVMGMSFFQMIVPVIAGAIIAKWGYFVVFAVMAGGNLLSIFFNFFLPKVKPKPAAHKNVMKDIGEGFRYIKKNRMILLVLVFFISSVLLVNPIQTLMPVFAKDILLKGVEGQGTLMSLMGAGSIAIAFLLASIPARKRGRTLLISNICMGVSMVFFAFSTSWPLSMIMMVLIGIGRIGADTCGNTMIQTYTDPGILGRVNSIVMVSFGFGGAMSFFIGILAETINAPWAIGSFAIVLVVTSTAALIFMPKFRNLD